MTDAASTTPTTVALLTLGCARNDVDSEELAARLEADGFQLVDEADDADTVVVNTCGFVEAAKKDSVDTLLAAADTKDAGRTQAVVAVGCMAERYGKDLAEALPEADAVLGFDDYPDIAGRLRSILAGEAHQPHVPADRRTLLPLSPVDRSDAAAPSLPGHGQAPESVDAPDLPAEVTPSSGPRALRRRLGSGPMAPLKLASGCDRRCSFCAIPSFRGSFVSRRPTDVIDEARWLAGSGVREVFLVSENSTSYGKDLGDIRLLESVLPALADVDGIERVRVSYLQPAEMRPTLIQVMASTPHVAQYFDLSFQHASGPVLRRMRRFGDAERFAGLVEQIRTASPRAGIRSNFIVGFPGESEADLEILCDFLTEARLDAVGIFGYSDEDGTEAVGLDGHLDDDEIAARAEHVRRLVDELTAQRAEDRIGERVEVLIESDDVHGDYSEALAESGADTSSGVLLGRAEEQGPEVDGVTVVTGAAAASVGDIVPATVSGTQGVDLIAHAWTA